MAKSPKPVQGVKKPSGPNPYTTQINAGAVNGRPVGYVAPSGGIGPHTGRPAGGYASTPPMAPGAAKAVADYHAQRSRAATGVAINPPQPFNSIDRKPNPPRAGGK